MDQSLEQITTRSKAQKKNNADRTMIELLEKTRQSKKKDKANIKNDLDISVKQNTDKKTPKAKKKLSQSAKKLGSRRKLELTDEDEATNIYTVQETLNPDTSELGIKTDLQGKVTDVNDIIIRTKKIAKRNGSPLNLKDLKRDKTPNKKIKWKIVLSGVKISPSMITPKSTPPKLSLTPHRSKKTPKKSPISLGSPKTHTKAVPRLLKSPRKLSLSNISGLENIDKLNGKTRKKKSGKTKRNSANTLSPSRMDLSMSPVDDLKRTELSTSLKSARRFSKHPKIVLKPPKAKKSRSPSKLRVSSPRVERDSLTNTLNLGTKSSKGTPSPRTKNLPSIKRRLLNSEMIKLMTASQVRDVLAEPVVLLEKLPRNVSSMLTVSRTKSNPSIELNSPSTDRRNSSKTLTPVTKSPVRFDASVDRNSSSKLKHSPANRSIRTSPRAKTDILIQKRNSSVPLTSSTPREAKLLLADINLTSNTPILSAINTSLNARTSNRSQSSMRLSNVMDKSTIIADVSKPSLIDISGVSRSSLVNGNDTSRQVCDENTRTLLEEQENEKDGTYELEQPETLNLQQMIRKRNSTAASLTLKTSSKKAKVRFANVNVYDTNSVGKSIKWSASRTSVSRDNTQRSNVVNSAHKLKMETPKLHRNSSTFKTTSSLSKNKFTPSRNQLNATQNTPTTFGSVSKKSGKKISSYMYFYILITSLYMYICICIICWIYLQKRNHR